MLKLQEPLLEERIYFVLQLIGDTSVMAILQLLNDILVSARTQGRNLEAVNKAEAWTNASYWFVFLYVQQPTFQDCYCLPKTKPTHIND